MDTTSLPPDDRAPVDPPRRVSRGLLWAAGLATVVLAIATVVAFVGGSGDDDVVTIEPGSPMPAQEGLTGTDVTGDALPQLTYKTFEGGEVPLVPADRPLLLNFWSSTCAPCIREMPALEASYLANTDRVDFLGLQVAERAESGLDMIATTGISYPVGRDSTAAIFRALGGVSLPRTVIVATDGTISFVHTGELDQGEIQAAIDQALDG